MSHQEGLKSNFNCNKCNEVDNDDMVQCDKCDKWYHFNCVGVNSGVSEVSWSCDGCNLNKETTSMEENQSAANTIGLLNVPQATSSPTNAGELLQMASKTTSGTGGRIPTASTASTSVNRPTNTLFQGKAKDNRTNTVPSSLVPVNSSAITGTHSSTSNINQPKPVSSQQNNNVTLQVDLQLKMLEEQQRMQQEFLERKYQILSQCSQQEQPHQNSFNMTSSWNIFSGPTPSQLAARHSIPRDLPHFHGDPEEWPLFISSFENSTAVAGYSHAENLIRLQSCLKGKAKELVRSKLMLPAMVPEIIQTLRMYFGRPEHILERVIEKARKFPPPKDKLEGIIEFALCVKNICSTMEACKLDSHLNNPMLVKELLDKLNSQYKLNWATHPKDDRIPIVKLFSDWIFQIADAASTVVSTIPSSRSAPVNTHAEDVQQSKIVCFSCRSNDHKVSVCSEFKKLSLDQKWKLVKTHNLCRQCLNRHRRKCFIYKECGIDGCVAKHHRLLHKYVDQQQTSSGQSRAISAANTTSETINSHSTKEQNRSSFFRILPVRLLKKKGFINTYAFLDEGSSVTLIERDVFDLLDLEGVEEPLCLKWTGDTTRQENTSRKASISIANSKNGAKFFLNSVHTVDGLDLPTQSLEMEELISKYKYLAGLPIESYTNVKPTILIGADNWKLAVPLKIREGLWNQPIATKTRLGWTIQGPNDCYRPGSWLNIHHCDCQEKYNELHQMVKENFNLEDSSVKTVVSAQDSMSMNILKTSCQNVDGRYEVGLLWKYNVKQLPESYNNARKRLTCLQKKFQKDKNLRDVLQEQINNLLKKGYARKLSDEEISNNGYPVWYLPTFITLNPNKPGKIRMVWDGAAKSNGVCLNDFIHCGPDLLKSLVDILLSFRVGKIAICGDIAEMFHRINVRKEDMHAQRFLWCDENDNPEKPSIYVMRALTFGICCAPCIAHYVRDFNAEQFKNEFPRAVEAIQQYHYVDDFIDSVNDDEQAIELASQVQYIHSAGGFHIRNWASNSNAVISHLQDDSSKDQKPRDLAETEKVLGMYWDPNKDSFVYIFRFARLRRDLFASELIPTKRELLQVLMSIFDPLGLISCYTTTLKILLQEVWRSGIDWDDEICNPLHVKWRKWKTAIDYISSIEISRCYSPHINEATEVELHTFVDAGEDAYAAVCYLRVAYQGGCDVTIVIGKSKVAPIKPMSIPRLELQAAIAGVRLANKVINIKRINFTSKYFWTDSKTVLQWLRMDPKKFQQFVMHRVGEILETTEVTQWRWVPSKMNPADLATKYQTRWDAAMWFSGPKFLHENKSTWPTCTNVGECGQEEMRHQVFIINKSKQFNLEYFSNWRKLYRAVATFILYVSRLKSRCKGREPPKDISFEMIQQAKVFLFRQAQESEYLGEICSLKKDYEGILRARGRVLYLNHQDTIILPTMHHVTVLLVRYVHENFHHISHETVINNIKSQYYIPKLRVLYKSIRRSCQHCKNLSANPVMPQMSTLPKARLASFERPFTYVGIDYFGPLYVTVGRRKEKRWGVLFTCLTVRAVHIEIAYSLDTSSCVMCINNFIARRGIPNEIYTDNGTNFKATAKIFSPESKAFDLKDTASMLDHIKWKFNPPAAPHMGGAWERLVRSVKTTVYTICPNANFNDETLRNAMAEAEFIINSRPLTFVSLESCDDEALTPNHLLLGSSSGYKPIVTETVDLRLRWRQTQQFSDQFWRRWVKEYMPTLTRRGKWFQKTEPLKVGDIVIIIDENLPRHCWPKGKIINTIIAKDGQVRQATVRTQHGVFQRPTAKLAKLDVGIIDQ
ncbi:uncharacterized protein isoform X2 [Musca autumnalis]|uniref:uncharacterized protein isoform X2 n=1 Tax=Musca autumnalis TaxID=221902 RepID=UPI003CFA96BF